MEVRRRLLLQGVSDKILKISRVHKVPLDKSEPYRDVGLERPSWHNKDTEKAGSIKADPWPRRCETGASGENGQEFLR